MHVLDNNLRWRGIWLARGPTPNGNGCCIAARPRRIRDIIEQRQTGEISALVDGITRCVDITTVHLEVNNAGCIRTA